jgi:hypothetical protein
MSENSLEPKITALLRFNKVVIEKRQLDTFTPTLKMYAHGYPFPNATLTPDIEIDLFELVFEYRQEHVPNSSKFRPAIYYDFAGVAKV